MVLDIEMLKQFYASYSDKINAVRQVIDRPLTYTEKVL